MSEAGEGEQRQTPRAADEVLNALYRNACEERNQMVTKNEMFAKLLESCAEKNNVLELEAAAARAEAVESRKAMETANTERDNAVIQLQQVQAEMLTELHATKAKAAGEHSELSSQLLAAQNRIAESEGASASALEELSSENTRLRSQVEGMSKEVALFPRIRTQAANQIRKESAIEIAKLTKEIVEEQKKMATETERVAVALREAEKYKSTLVSEVDELKQMMVTQQQRAHESHQAAQVEIASLLKTKVNLEEQVSDLSSRLRSVDADQQKVLNDAHRRFDEYLAKVQAEHTTTVQALQKSEENFRGAITEMSLRLQNLTSVQDELQANFQREKDEHQNALASETTKVLECKDELCQLKLALRTAAKEKNEAIKKVRDALMFASTDHPLHLVEKQQIIEDLQRACTRPTPHAPLVVEMPSPPNVHEALQVADLAARLESTESQLEGMAAVASKHEDELLASATQARTQVEQLECKLLAVKSAHRAALEEARAEHHEQLHGLRQTFADQEEKISGEFHKLQSLISLNAESVRNATAWKEQHEAQAKAIEQLQAEVQKLRASTAEGSQQEYVEGKVGGKRRRKG